MAQTIDVPSIKKLSWTATTTYTPASIITYNIALGVRGTDLARCFEGDANFGAVPTFGTLPVIAVMGDVTRSMASFLPGFQPHNHVHGEHYLELKRPFPAKGATTLRTTARIVDVVDRRSGVIVAVGITTSDADTGEQICYNEWTSFVMKVPGHGAAAKPIPRGPATASHPSPNRAPDAIVEYTTSPEQGALYRAASGDLNPLHIDPVVAKAGGFPGPILTGTCTLGMGVLHVVDTFAEGDFARFKNAKVRLSKPVFPGEVVRTEMWKDSGGRILYRMVVKEEGGKDRVVISQAAVELKGVEGRL
jgi:peroxisomal enoyl-CoA hydratase 2